MKNIEDITIDEIFKDDEKYYISHEKSTLDEPELLSFLGLYGGEQSIQEILSNLNRGSLFTIKKYWKPKYAIEILSNILIKIASKY